MDAWAVDSDTDVTDKNAGTIKDAYTIDTRYSNATDPLRANKGQVILAGTSAPAGAPATPLSASNVVVPEGNAMDTASAVTYHWTNPVAADGGDVGQVAPAYGIISGYVWSDNKYKEGAYNTDGGTYIDEEDEVQSYDPEQGYYNDPNVPVNEKTVYLRQWYFDPEATQANGKKGDWLPTMAYSDSHDSATGTYSFDTTRTVGKNTAVASGTVHHDGYFEFTNLPVRVIVGGKEYLAGYTAMVIGDAISMTTFEEIPLSDTQDASRAVPEIDAWNSKARGIVSNTSDQSLIDRFGTGNFPLFRSSHVGADGSVASHREPGADGKEVAVPLSNSDGKTHAIDGVIVLAGSTTADATTATTGTAPVAGSYNVSTDAYHQPVGFNLTYAKNETYMNGGIVEPPSAPIVGMVWDDADYDGIRSEDEEGIAGVQIQVIPYYYAVVDTDADGNDVWGWVRAVEYEAQLESVNQRTYYTMDGTGGTIKGRYATANMPTKFRYDADGHFVPATEEKEGTDYLAGYRIVVTKMPVRDGVTATLTRNHAAGADDSLLNVESDLFRSGDGTSTSFIMKNRDHVSVLDPDGNPTEAVKDGGMVIVAHSVTGNVADQYRKEYFGPKGNSIIYDISTNVPQRNGGDAGLVFIPYTSIEGDVWDDTYKPAAGDVLNLAARGRAYNGIRDSWMDAQGNQQTEPGLPDRTMMITQWQYAPAGDNGAAGTWQKVNAFGTKTTLTGDGTNGAVLGHYAFDRLPSAVSSSFKNTYDVVREVNTFERNADGTLTVKDVAGNSHSQEYWSDQYWLTSYQVEIKGFDATTQGGANDNGERDGLWMLTRYHEGADADGKAADSDVRTDERAGVAGGRPLRDQDTLAGQDGVRAGSPDNAVGSTGTGARIVVASVGDNAAGDTKTNLKYTTDYVNVAAGQLLYDEATGAAATGTVSYDWLTVPFAVSTTGTGDAAVTTKTKTPLAGGNVGLVQPGTQSIEGILWYDEDNDGVQDGAEEGLNGYRVDIERYFYNEKKGAWERIADYKYQENAGSAATGTLTHQQNLSEVPGGSDYDYWRTAGNPGMPSELDLACGQSLGATGTMQDGYYRFADLATMGLVYLDAAGNVDPDGAETKVVFGYKVKVTDRQVVSGQLLKSKLNVKGLGLDYTTDSDLQRTNYLTAADEYIVLLEQVDANGQTPDGKTANTSNIAWAPASHNADQTATLADPMTSAAHPGLVAYDYMAGADRAHNDGGVIRLPKYSISGYVWADEDYDGLFEWYPQDRIDDKGAVVERNYVEAGYNGKKVFLKKWYYDPEATVTDDDGNVTTGAWLPWESTADAVRENGPAAQEMLTGTNPAQVYGTAQDGNGDEYKLTYDVDGYYEFANLPTAYAKVDADGNYQYYLAGYTVELSGKNSPDGMVSLLATTHQWATTAKDAINSKVQPMLTKEGAEGDWGDYTEGNYPIQWDEDNLQTGAGRYINNKPEGLRDGVSRNLMDGKIVLAGIADADTYENQKLTATRGPAKLSFDFAFGQKQTAMNAGFAPPDHTNLTGKVWLDEDFDGLFTDDNPLDNVTVVLTQFYFVPNLDTSGTHQLFEDREGNLFYWEDDEDGSGERKLRLEKAAPTSSVIVGNDGTVYFVRADRVYSYEKLLDLDILELSESGTWVENTNLVGNGESVVLAVNGHGQDIVLDENGNPQYGVDVKLDENGVPVDELERVQLNPDGTIRTHTLGAHQIVAKTDEGGDYNFYDLPSYVLVDSTVADPAHPGSDISKVYQPRTDFNKVFAGYQTDENGEFVLDENGHKVPTYTNGFASWKVDADGNFVLDEEGNKIPVYDDEQSFGSANHYLVGYAVRVINPDGKYMASRYHVDAPEGAIDSDLHSFDASMSGKFNDDGTMEETYAVVAQQTKSGNDTAKEPYEVEYKGIVYDLANRLYLKHAGNAGLILQHPVYISGRVWDDVNADGLQDSEESEPGIKGALVRLTRYWFDTTGIGSLESAPSDAWDDVPSVDDTELTQEELDFIINMDEDDPEAMIAWINAVAEDEGDGSGSGSGSGTTEPEQPLGPADPTTVTVDTTPVDTMDEGGMLAEAAGYGVTPEVLARATKAQLEFIAHDSDDDLQARLSQLIFGNYTGDDADGKPLFDGKGCTALKNAYDARMAELAAQPDVPEGKPLRTYEELKAFERAHYFFIYGYGELLDKPDGSGQIVVEHPGNEAVENALTAMMFRLAEASDFDEDQKNVWRRDWSFNQSDVAVLAEEGDLASGGLAALPTEAELKELVGDEVPLVSVRQDADGTVNIPGSVFDHSVYNGDWAFLASGTGLHQVKGSGASFKVLYGYRVEIISYPDEDIYEPTLQNIGDNDHINSNYDADVDALRPNDFDVTLAHTTEEMGDLIILTTLAQPDEGMSIAGPYEEYANMEVADELLEGSGILDDLINNNGVISGGTSTVATRVAAAKEAGAADGQAAASVALFAAVQTVAAAIAGNPMPRFSTSAAAMAGEGDGTGEGGAADPDAPVVGTTPVEDMTDDEKLAEAETLGVTAESLAAASMAQLAAIAHDSDDPVQARLSQLIFGNYTGDDADGKPQFDGAGAAALLAAYTDRYEYLQGEFDKIGTDDVADMTDNQKVAEAEALGYSVAAIAGMSKEELTSLTHDSAEPVKARMSQLIYGNYTGDDADGKPVFDGNGSATLKAAVDKRLYDLAINDTDPSTMAEQEKLAEAAALGLTPEWINNATYQQLIELSPDSDDKAAQRKAQLIFGNVVGRDENGQPVYDGSGSTTLRAAYNDRIDQIMNQVGTNGYSEVNWHNSPYHDFGVVRIARASISGYIWEDGNYDGIWAEGEQKMFPDQPITLERYWWGADENGKLGWNLDEGFKANTTTDADGYWHFDDLEVAGRRDIDGERTMVLYGYRVYVDDLPKNYGVTFMNQGADANADSDLDEMTKILDPADPQGGMNRAGRADRSAGLRSGRRQRRVPGRPRRHGLGHPRRRGLRAQRYRPGALRTGLHRRQGVHRSRAGRPEGQHLAAGARPHGLPGAHGASGGRGCRRQACGRRRAGRLRLQRPRLRGHLAEGAGCRGYRAADRLAGGGFHGHGRQRRLPLRRPAHGRRAEPSLHLPGAHHHAGRLRVGAHERGRHAYERLARRQQQRCRRLRHVPDGRRLRGRCVLRFHGGAGLLPGRPHRAERLRPDLQLPHPVQLGARG